MLKMSIVLLSIMMLAAVATTAPERFPTMWTSVAAGCVPAETAIKGDRYAVVAGSVGLRTTATGLTTFYCPVTRLGRETLGSDPYGNTILVYRSFCPDNEYVLRLTYADGDGRGDGVNVSAELLGLAIATGVWGSTGARVSSSDSDATTATNQAVAFTNPIDPDAFYYYVRVDLSRARGNESTATFYGVSLECTRP